MSRYQTFMIIITVFTIIWPVIVGIVVTILSNRRKNNEQRK
jgi:heme/copper-type cytochrome/quinol oxidase subunit 2